MNTHRTRRWLAAAAIAAAVTGGVTAVVAASGDSGESPTKQTMSAAEVVERMPAGWPATEAMRQELP